MNKPLTILSLLFLSFFPAAYSSVANELVDPYFEWSPLAKSAYEKATELRINEASNLIERLRQEEPQNYLVHFLENYLDFFRIYINEDKSEFQSLEPNKDKRIRQLKDGDEDSPWYLYTQANIRLQWALARLKFEEYATAFFEVNKAFKLLKRNSEKYPDFMPNKKDLGILHAISGTIPDGYKWAVDWLSSMEGSIEQGQRELEEVIDYAKHNDFIFEKEIYIFYAYLMLHLNQNEEAAWQIINSSNLDPSTDPMACFIVANIAMRIHRNNDAITLLQNRPAGRAFLNFPYLDYMLGIAKQRRLDSDAEIYLKRFIDQFKGRNFIKDAYQKIAWQHIIKGDTDAYFASMQKCRTEGYTIVGSDKSAMEEAESGQAPHADLLKARLLFDGGYFEQAESLLYGKDKSFFARPQHQLEFTYRKGRINHSLGKLDQALIHYEETIQAGKDQPWYFACRSALEIGLIYERRNNLTKAREYYEICLSIKPEEHRVALHQQAKAGINRVK